MESQKHRPVGVFDSGLGGLTVVKQMQAILPAERLVYVGDTARVPYGTKSPQTVRRYALQIASFLQTKQVKAIVVACNTASAAALPALRRLPVPVIGVIDPGARAAVRASRSGRIGVIGTPSTIASGAYRRFIQRLSPRANVTEIACPLFVPLVEEGRVSGDIVRRIAKAYLAPFKRRRIDTLVLGCTHYPLLKGALASVVGPSVRLIDSAAETAKRIESVLREADMLASRAGRRGTNEFYSTDEPLRFRALGVRFLGGRMPAARLLSLDEA